MWKLKTETPYVNFDLNDGRSWLLAGTVQYLSLGTGKIIKKFGANAT